MYIYIYMYVYIYIYMYIFFHCSNQQTSQDYLQNVTYRQTNKLK